MRNSIFFILAILSITMLFSCEKQEKKIVLLLSPEESVIGLEEGYKLDSIIIRPYNGDTIVLLQYNINGIFGVNHFFEQNDVLFEIKPIFTVTEIPGKIIGHDNIMTFARKDTTFIHRPKIRFFPGGMGHFDAECYYTIKQLKEGYVTIKQSAIDKTFRELYFYDNDYNVYKYILTLHYNMFVYNKKE